MWRPLVLALVLLSSVPAQGLRQKDLKAASVSSEPPSEGLFVPSRNGQEGGSALVPGEKPAKAESEDRALKAKQVCEEKAEPLMKSNRPGAATAQYKAPSGGSNAAVTAEMVAKMRAGGAQEAKQLPMAGEADLDRLGEEADEIGKASMELAKTINSTRAWVSLINLCDQTHRGGSPGYYLGRALIMAKNLIDFNSSYPYVLFITDEGECDLQTEYEGKYIAELNVHFVRMPMWYFRKEDMPAFFGQWTLNLPKTYYFAMAAFERLVHVDLDIVFMRNSDDLFDLPEPQKIYMSTMQFSCDQRPFDANNLGGVTHLMVLSPSVADYTAQKYQYTLARKSELHTADSMIMQQLYGAQGRISLLSPAEMLNSECLINFSCRMDSVRALHLGDIGQMIVTSVQPLGDIEVEMDRRWTPVFQKWVSRCHSKKVRRNCGKHCNEFCVNEPKWTCYSC